MGKHTFELQIAGQQRSASVDILEIKDIVMFVAGTTDPVNTVAENHQANKTYWQGEQGELDNLWRKVKALKPQYLDLHIEDSFFSWSGDNSNEARTKAAERLLDLFLRVYSGWTEKTVFLHLIGHSHGGNVINQFTEIIANSQDFPEQWSIKSITYLSTPFFQEQHQLNHTKLHPECKIINVYNEYDITQRFVADFTLKNLESLILNFNPANFNKAIEEIRKTNFSAFDHLTDIVINNKTEGPFLWRETEVFLRGLKTLCDAAIEYVSSLSETGILSGQKAEFLSLLNNIRTWAIGRATVFERHKVKRKGGYGRSEYFNDLDLLTVFRFANTLFAINKGVEDSYILGVLDQISNPDGQGSITDRIDDTTWTPAQQVKGSFEIVQVPILTKDDYHSRNKKNNYDTFITGIEQCVRDNKPYAIRELLMRLFSQMISPQLVKDVLDKLPLAELYFTGKKDTEVKTFKRSLKKYYTLINTYHADLITEADRQNEALTEKPGSLPYLSMVSHSLSHTELFPEVKEALCASFGSGKNPGYNE